MIALDRLCPEIAPQLEQVAAEIASIAASDSASVDQAARHVANSVGKRLRPSLMLLAARAVRPDSAAASGDPGPSGVDGERCIMAAAVIEVLHGVSLVHDDVIDEAETRRGSASARMLWGNKMAVLLGDHLLAGAFKRLTKSGDAYVMAAIADTAVEMCRGQIQEIALAGPDLTEAQYLEIVSAKTASLFATSCRLGAALAGGGECAQQALDAFGRGFGIAYQITDDLLDLTGTAREMGKPVARDLAQGQITMPLIYALREGSAAQRAQLLACLDGRPGRAPDALDLAAVRRVVADAGGIAYAANRAQDFCQQAMAELETLPPSSARESLLALARDGLNSSVPDACPPGEASGRPALG
jgi:octaprenyl-diphosphate synthase